MRIVWLLLFYGLSISTANAAIISTGAERDIFLSSIQSRLIRGDRPAPNITPTASPLIDIVNRTLILTPALEINAGGNITISENPKASRNGISVLPGVDKSILEKPSLSVGNVTLLSGGNISLTSISGAGIRTLSGGNIEAISAPWGASMIVSGALIVDGEIGISGKNIAIIPGVAGPLQITSVPLPASFTLLLTGLLTLLSLSGRSMIHKSR